MSRLQKGSRIYPSEYPEKRSEAHRVDLRLALRRCPLTKQFVRAHRRSAPTKAHSRGVIRFNALRLFSKRKKESGDV